MSVELTIRHVERRMQGVEYSVAGIPMHLEMHRYMTSILLIYVGSCVISFS